MEIKDLVFVGIKGNAIALNQSTGAIVWQTPLTSGLSGGFVYLVLDAQNLYATVAGEVFCLDPVTGEIRWHNPLKGMGLGLASIAVCGGITGDEILAAVHLERQREAAASAGAGV